MQLNITRVWNTSALREQEQYSDSRYLVVVSTEIFKVSKADVGEADDYRDDQNYECEHGRCGGKPWVKESGEKLVLHGGGSVHRLRPQWSCKWMRAHVRTWAACRWGPRLTGAYSGEEQKPKEAENGSSNHLVYSSRVDLLVQFGWQISVVHVVSVREVFQQHVHQPCTRRGDKTISGSDPIRPDDKPLYEEQSHWTLPVPCGFTVE